MLPPLSFRQMKKLLLYLLVGAQVALFAGIGSVGGYEDKPFYQFTYNDLNEITPGTQSWLAAKTIGVHIGGEMDVWLTNYISSWYADIPALNGNEFNMGAGQYGAIDANTGKTWTGTGETTTVTYEKDGHANSTEGYFLGHFKGGEDLVLWLTSVDADAATSGQLVNDELNPSSLVSRVNGTQDQAGNIRLNFGYNTENGLLGHELVAFGVITRESDAPTGQPLPGAMVSALLMGGVAGLARCRRKRIVERPTDVS